MLEHFLVRGQAQFKPAVIDQIVFHPARIIFCMRVQCPAERWRSICLRWGGLHYSVAKVGSFEMASNFWAAEAPWW
jgi:hypothetical protein